MSDLVQNGLAIAACLAAVVFVGWRTWKTLAGRKSGCGAGCGSCSSSGKSPGMPTAKPLLSIEVTPEGRTPSGEPYIGDKRG